MLEQIDGEPDIIVSEPSQMIKSPRINATTYAGTATSGHQSIVSDMNYWLRDMEYLYQRSFNELEVLFRTGFR